MNNHQTVIDAIRAEIADCERISREEGLTEQFEMSEQDIRSIVEAIEPRFSREELEAALDAKDRTVDREANGIILTILDRYARSPNL